MITLHKLNGDAMTLNAELIEIVEATPDTLITLVDRRRLMVSETVEEVVDAVVAYRRRVSGAPVAASHALAA